MDNIKSKSQIRIMLLSSIIILGFAIVMPEAYENYTKLSILLFGCIATFVYEPMAIVILVLSLTNMLDIAVIQTANSGITLADSALAVMACLFVKEYLIRGKKTHSRGALTYFLVMLAVMICLSASVLVAYFKYDQPIFRGLSSFRPNLILFIIFPLSKYIKRANNYNTIINYCINIVTVASLLCLIQYFLYDKFLFLKMTNSIRYDSTRLFMHDASPLMCFAFGYTFYDLLKASKEKVKIKNIITLFILTAAMFIAVKTRIFEGCYILTFLLVLFSFKSKIKPYQKLILFVLICLIALMQFGNISSYLNNKIFADVTGNTESYIRSQEIDFFMSQMGDSYFWGGGIGNLKHALSPIYIGSLSYFYIVDIGIIGYYFEYGVIGIMAFAILLYILAKGNKKYSSRIINLLVCFILITTAVTVSPNAKGNYLIMIIALSGRLLDIRSNVKLRGFSSAVSICEKVNEKKLRVNEPLVSIV